MNLARAKRLSETTGFPGRRMPVRYGIITASVTAYITFELNINVPNVAYFSGHCGNSDTYCSFFRRPISFVLFVLIDQSGWRRRRGRGRGAHQSARVRAGREQPAEVLRGGGLHRRSCDQGGGGSRGSRERVLWRCDKLALISIFNTFRLWKATIPYYY